LDGRGGKLVEASLELAMSTQFATLEAEALKLPSEERALLADHLLASLGAAGEAEQAWVAEVEHRLAEVEAGHIELVPIEQAILRALQALS
jgi:putative addiction module component (TIGR02574 family)